MFNSCIFSKNVQFRVNINISKFFNIFGYCWRLTPKICNTNKTTKMVKMTNLEFFKVKSGQRNRGMVTERLNDIKQK